ncbi:MAG: glutaredoxin family protein [Gammaproteobacteria bacterium]|nr:glutaredoxin family protein [Gammaproteobacteria bacterium]
MPSLVFYYRDGCHLCEELAGLLFRHWPAQAEHMEWRDVDQRPEWREAYGHRIPVLLADDALVSELVPDPERIAQYFEASNNPV